MSSKFRTNPFVLSDLLRNCAEGKLQLPDFQRSWVWDEERIKSLIASISQAFPIGALMTLEVKPGAKETFAWRPIQGAPKEVETKIPNELLLDGQQRMTSLYQTCLRRKVVRTITPRQKLVDRWFYIDIRKALSPDVDREDAILSVPEDRKVKANFDKEILLDLSTAQAEYEHMMFPVNDVFDWDNWQDGFYEFWEAKEKKELFKRFKNEVLQNFKAYQVPVITLADDTSHAAVCLVFEKVNTGGKALDAFELVTAMYAARGHRLRDDWLGANGEPGIQGRLQTFGQFAGQKFGVLEKVASTDFLQAIALLHSKREREKKVAEGAKDSELPAVRATRQSLLELPLEAYLEWRGRVEAGFKTAARFLRQLNIYRVTDLPYQSQLVPLAAILAEIDDGWEPAANKAKLARWFWCGIFGELYGSTTETRFARDIMEVPTWLDGGPEPTTVRDGVFRTDRLRTMRSRLSAAYKGIHALLMKEGAIDFRTGQSFDQTVFFDERVDIHHIFPEAWCKEQGIEPKVYDTIINKTPLGDRTNRILSGAAPSKYIAKLEKGRPGEPPLDPTQLDRHVASHAINPDLLRADDFYGFIADRERRLLDLISSVTGHRIAGPEPEDTGEVDLPDDIAHDAGLVRLDAD